MKRLRLLQSQSRVARGASGSFVLQGAEALLGFVTSIIAARILGVSEFGAYAFGITLAGFLSIPGLLGYRTLAIREVSSRNASHEWTRLDAFVSGSLKRVFFSSLLVTLLAFLTIKFIEDQLSESLATAALIALPIVPLIAVLRLHESYLKGIDRVVLAQVPDRLVRPILFIVAVSGASLIPGLISTGAILVSVNMVSTAVGLVVVLILWAHFRPTHKENRQGKKFDDANYRNALPFALIAGVFAVNSQTDILMLGILTGADETGVYRVSSRVAALVSFVLTALTTVIAPRIAALHSTKDFAAIQRLCARAAVLSSISALSIVSAFALGSEQILLLFGEGFQIGSTVLIILGIGQFANALTGAVGPLLSMTGNQDILAQTLIFSAVFNVSMNALLIPFLGAEGAAIATMLTLVAWNFLLAIRTKAILNIDVTAIHYVRHASE